MAELKLVKNKAGEGINRYIYINLTKEEKDIQPGNKINEANSFDEEFDYIDKKVWKDKEYAECLSQYGIRRAFYLDSIKRSSKELESIAKEEKRRKKAEINKKKEDISKRREERKLKKEQKLIKLKNISENKPRRKSKGYINKKIK